MIISPYTNRGLSAGLGQYVTAKATYFCDEMISGKVLRFWPSTYTPGVVPRSPAFQILYPASPGIYEFTNLGCKNYKASLKVIDAQTFEIQYHFFATKNFSGFHPISSHQNSTAFSFQGTQAFEVNMFVQVDDATATGIVPITVAQSCQGINFVESGFTPGEDFTVQIEADVPIGNNFYCALINDGAVNNNTDIVNGLIASYVKIANVPVAVDDLPDACISAGLGFAQYSGQSSAYVTVSGACLQNGGNYRLLVIYMKGGQWMSCLSDVMSQARTNAPIIPDAEYLVNDYFETTGGQCISKVANVVPLNFNLEIDTADFAVKLQDAGMSGEWSDYYAGVRAYMARSSDAIGGKALQVSETSDYQFSVSNFTTSETGTIFIIFQVEVKYPDHSDFINFPFKVTYNAQEVDINVGVQLGGVDVQYICPGNEYTIDADFEGCQIYQSINGSANEYNTIIDGSDLDITALEIGDTACFKVVCPGEASEACDCSDCGDIVVTATKTQLAGTGQEMVQFCGLGIESGIVEYSSNTYGGGGGEFTTSFSEGCSFTLSTDDITDPDDPSLPGYVTQIIVNRIEVTTENGCVYEIFPNIGIASTPSPPSSNQVYEFDLLLVHSDCNCDEAPEVNECTNTAAFNYTCDEETGDIAIEVIEAFESPTDGDPVFELSTDGGMTFIPCPSTISGAYSAFVRYRAKFTDGCPEVYMEQAIECNPLLEFTNTREVEIEVVGDELIINITDSWTSTDLQDTLRVSIDNGVTFDEFTPSSTYTPIALEGEENIVVEWNVIFDDGTPDLHGIKTLKNINQTAPADCAGYDDYTLAVEYDELTGIFTATKTGNETVLLVNDLRFSLGMVTGNPFDDNGSGVPYTDPVRGEGMFIAAWKIKLADCAPKILYATTFGKECIKFCDPIEITVPDVVNVVLPETPIEVCLVECCASFTPAIECVDMVLTVTNAPEGADLSWVGPGGFSATGNGITVEVEGTYTVTVNDTTAEPPCVSTGSYVFNYANAGEPIDDPIDVT